MPRIEPLSPLLYDLTRIPSLGAVVAPPYDVIDGPLRGDLEARHPYNAVRLELPRGEGDAKYTAAAERLSEWQKEGVLARGATAFYVLEQTFPPPFGIAGPPIRRRGLLAAVRLSPFGAGEILPHERTLAGPKEDRLKLLRATHTAMSPGFLLYRDEALALEPLLDASVEIASFEVDQIAHRFSKIEAPEAIAAIQAVVGGAPLLIADGHHRYETALAYEAERDAEGGSSGAPHHYYLAFLANGDGPDLLVVATHRHLHSLRGVSLASISAAAAPLFDVEPLPEAAPASVLLRALARRAGESVVLVVAVQDGRALRLSLRPSVNLAGHPSLGSVHPELRKTDVAVLHHGLLEGGLGLTREAQAAKTNLWYPQDAKAALLELRTGRGDALFLMNPTPVADVRRVAEAGEVMPQKSTFFYPKVPTGLVFHPV